jgi:hypothetical protein
MSDPKLSANHRRALQLIADSADGLTESMLSARWIKRIVIGELIGAGLVSATVERIIAGRKPREVRRIKITDAGQTALK